MYIHVDTHLCIYSVRKITRYICICLCIYIYNENDKNIKKE